MNYQAIRVYVDASKGFTIATFGTIQGVYLAKKLLEWVVLHGQKVVVHCNQATTARLRTEKFKYGEEERDAETKVKGEIEGLVEACNREGAGDDARGGRNGDAAMAADDFLATLSGGGGGGGGVEGPMAGERRGGRGQRREKAAGQRPNGSRREYEMRYDLMMRNEKSRLARLEREEDKRRDLAQERHRQILADNEGVGDPRATWPVHARKPYRGSREHLERKKRQVKELEEDEKEAARMDAVSNGAAASAGVASGVASGGGGGGQGNAVETAVDVNRAEGTKHGNVDNAGSVGNAGNYSSLGNIGVKRKKMINFDDEKETEETIKVDVQKEAVLARSIMQRLPKSMDELNAYPIKWDVFDAAPKATRGRISEWIGKKIAELLGDEKEFVEYIFEGIQNHKHPRDMVADVQDVLDDDTDAFVVDLYGKVIFEIEKRGPMV